MSISILYPENFKEDKLRKMSKLTWHDLAMDQICARVTNDERELQLIRQTMSQMTDEPCVAAYRMDIFEDLLRNPSLRNEMQELLTRINDLQDNMSLKRNIDKSDSLWTLTRRLQEIDAYITCVENLHQSLAKAEIHSAGLLALQEYIRSICKEAYFAELKADIDSLRLQTRKIKSITLGINLNENYQAESMGIVSLNDKKFSKPGILSGFTQKLSQKDQVQNGTSWENNYTYHAPDLESPENMGVFEKSMRVITAATNPLMGVGIGLSKVAENDTALNVVEFMDQVATHMISLTVRELKSVLAKYASVNIYEITGLIPEFLYYIRWSEYIEKLTAEGFVFSKASIREQGEAAGMTSAEAVYNLKLVSIEKAENIISNDLVIDAEHWVYILTGANRGGKTTITQAIGQLFVLAQGGIYIPGKGFSFAPVDCIYTHFPADEDKTADFGRLGEECARFQELFHACTSTSLLLLNETFSTTSFEEGYYIAQDALKAILVKGIRTIYNTHMHRLAKHLSELNIDMPKKAASLIVESEAGKRSFKVKIAPPEGNSYARDIAEKYGVTLEQLLGPIAE